MASDFDIAVGVLNRAEIKKLERDIDDLEDQIVKLDAAYKLHNITDAQFNASMRVKGQKIDDARTKIHALTEENIRLGESIESGVNPSMRAAVHVMDQLAMGSEGLIRSIPALAQQFGVGSDLVLGLGALTLAIDMTAKHWGELREQFYAGLGLDRTKSDLETIAALMSSAPEGSAVWQFGRGLGENIKVRAERAESDEIRARTARTARAGKALTEGTQTEEERRIGEIFKQVIDEYGGEKLFGEIYQRETEGRALTPTQRSIEKERIYADIERAARGKVSEEFYGREFGPAFEAKRKEILLRRGEEVTEREADIQEKERERIDKEMGQAALKEWDDMIKEMEAGIRATTKHQIEQLEDQKMTLERQRRDMARDVHRTIYSSVEEHARGSQLGILNEIPKRRLKLAEELNKKIDEVNNNITRLRRGAVFQ